MTYPRWATERSAESAAGRAQASADSAEVPRSNRWWLRPLRSRLLLVLALTLVGLIVAILGADAIGTPGLAAASGALPHPGT